MGLTDLTVRLMLIFFPGIICLLIVEALTTHGERKAHETILYSYIFGFLSYIFYGLVAFALGTRFVWGKPWIKLGSWDVSFFKWLSNPGAQLDFLEIVSATAIALIGAFVISYVDKKKWLILRFGGSA